MSIIKKLKTNLGYILIGIGVLILLAQTIKQPFAVVSFGGAKIEGISQISAIRLFVGIILVVIGIYIQYKNKRK